MSRVYFCLLAKKYAGQLWSTGLRGKMNKWATNKTIHNNNLTRTTGDRTIWQSRVTKTAKEMCAKHSDIMPQGEDEIEPLNATRSVSDKAPDRNEQHGGRC